MSEHIIEDRANARFFRERSKHDTASPRWIHQRALATRYPTKADAERRIDAMCSCLTRHYTFAVPAKDATMGRAAA